MWGRTRSTCRLRGRGGSPPGLMGRPGSEFWLSVLTGSTWQPETAVETCGKRRRNNFSRSVKRPADVFVCVQDLRSGVSGRAGED